MSLTWWGTWWGKIPWNEEVSKESANPPSYNNFRKKKAVTCRFNAPWTPSMETRIVHCEENIDEMKVKSSKKLSEKILSYIVKIDDVSYVTQSGILGKCGVT